jgi:short-subunit dehydrogenase
MLLSGKRVLITGAGHGLGKSIALAAAAEGAEVIVTDRDPQLVDLAVDEIKAANGIVSGYAFDVTDLEGIRRTRDQIVAKRGPIDVLINNAGVVFGGEFLNVSLEKHCATLAVNLVGLMNTTQVFLPDLQERPEAAIVNIASASAFVPLPRAATYAASKAGALAFGDSLREELRVQGRRNLFISAICPSFIATGLFDGARPPLLTWMLTPERVARAVVKAIRREKKLVILPWTARWLVALSGVLPGAAYRRLCAWLGVSRSMKGWKGHHSK